MNWDQVQGKWKQYKGQLRTKWGKLTDNDLDVIEGNRQQLVGKVQEYYGLTKENAEKQVDEFVHNLQLDQKADEQTRRAGQR
ncbi:MAG: CsbD family protein [Candidatus Acidiferrales bacterium]